MIRAFDTNTSVMRLQPSTARSTQEAACPPDIAAVFERHFRYVWATLRRLGVRDRDLEDVTHELFLQVNKHLGSYEPSRPMQAWLFGFAHRMAADYRRLARHRIALVGDCADLEDALDGRPAQDEQIEAREAAILVQRALDQIDFDQRAVFVLHDIEGHPMNFVAETLSIGVNTGYSRLRLARARFATLVRRMQSEGSE
jgi:RNA polymerase sigma-70 factor (ECF subfamily)